MNKLSLTFRLTESITNYTLTNCCLYYHWASVNHRQFCFNEQILTKCMALALVVLFKPRRSQRDTSKSRF